VGAARAFLRLLGFCPYGLSPPRDNGFQFRSEDQKMDKQGNMLMLAALTLSRRRQPLRPN
jgi:hypothetical protein